MKRITKTILLAAALSLVTNVPVRSQEKYIVRVDGLSCAYCAYSLEKSLKSLEGVTQVEINLKEGTATLTLSEATKLKEEVIKQTVKDSGFTPRSVKKIEKEKPNG